MVRHTPLLPTLRNQREEDSEFKASLDHMTRPYLKQTSPTNATFLYKFFFDKLIISGKI